MTCIVALRHDKGVTLGADRQGTAGHLTHYSVQPKISERSGLLIGTAGSYRLSQVLEHELDWDDATMRLRDGDDPHPWAVKKLIPAIRAVLGTHAILKTDNGVAEVYGEALIVVRQRILVLHSDLQIYENQEPYAAIGSGSEVALGSLWSTAAWKDSAERVRIALEAADRWISSVGGPFDYLNQPSTLNAESKP